jgi:hypothetical protein
MANIGTTSRPAYVYDQETDTWVPVGVGPHTHENFVQSTIIDAKGDLLAGSSPDTVGRLPIGANGTMLVADSTETLGLAWANNITVNSSTDAFRITQTGSGNAFVVEDSASTDSTAFVIDTSGNVGIGLTVPGQKLDISADGPAHLQQTRYSTNATPALHYFRKARGTAASPSIVSSGDIVGGLYFNPYDGVGFVEGAQLLAVVDGTPGTNDMPTRLSFFTSPDGSATTAERMRITSGGDVLIGTSSIYPTTPTTVPKLTVVSDSNLNDVNTNAFLSLRNKNNTNATTVVGGILSDTYRDVADPHYSAGIWFIREPFSGNASTAGSIVFGTGSNVSGNTLPTERMRISSDGAVSIPLVQNPQSGTTFGPIISDAGKLVELSNTSAITVTIPLNSSVPFPVGTQINLLQTNTGQVSVVGAGGVTLNATPGAKLRTQWSFATLIKRAENIWVLVGDITA